MANIYHSCYVAYFKKTGKKIPADRLLNFANDVEVKLEALKNQGIFPDDLIADGTMTHQQNIIDQQIRTFTAKQNVDTASKLNRLEILERKFEGIKKSSEILQKENPTWDKRTADFYALMGTLGNNNYTRAVNPIEDLINGVGAEMTANIRKASADIFGEGFDALKHIDSEQFGKNWRIELYEIFKNPNANKSVTGDAQVFAYAKRYFEATFGSAHAQLQLANQPMRLNKMPLKVSFQKQLVNNTNEEEFVKDLIDNLDSNFHGPTTKEKEILARNIYQQYKKENVNWREIGETTFANDKRKSIFNEDGQLIFKSGEAFDYMQTKYSVTQTNKMLVIQHVQELTNKVALTRFFGPDPKKGFKEFFKEAEKLIPGLRPSDKFALGTLPAGKQARGYFDLIEARLNPHIEENSLVAPIMGAARAMESASLLGGASVTAIIDPFVTAFRGPRIFKLPQYTLLSELAKPHLSKKPETKLFLAHFIDYHENLIDGAMSRYNVGNSTSWYKLSQKYNPSNFTQFIFKNSGLNWMTRNTQRSSASGYTLTIGKLIKAKVAWNDIDGWMAKNYKFTAKGGKGFRSNFEKFGFDKKDWDTLLRKQPLDGRDRLNLFELNGSLAESNQTAYGGSTTGEKLMSIVRDGVNTMTPKGGWLEEIAMGLLSTTRKKDPITGKMGVNLFNQVAKSITQFKSVPTAITRKDMFRQIKNPNMTKFEKIRDLTYGMLPIVVAGGIVYSAKEVLSGRALPRWDTIDFWTRALETSGPAGILTDTMFRDFGMSDFIESIFTDKNMRDLDPADFLYNLTGPVIQDLTELVFGTINLGKDIVQGEGQWRKSTFDLTRQFLQWSGAETFILTRLLYRKYGLEILHEMIDPDGYNRRKNRLQRDAQEKKVDGNVNNFIFEALPGGAD